MLDTIDRILEHASAILKSCAAALLLLFACLIAADVLLRLFINRPIIGVAEIVANGIVIIAYLQLSYTVRIGSMLRSELLVSQLSSQWRVALETIIALFGVLFFGLITWASYTPMMRAIGTGEFEGHASFQVPTWPVRVVIVSCSLLAIVNYLAQAYRALARGETAFDIAQAAETKAWKG